MYSLVKKILSNKIVGFVLSRYATYFIQFVNSLFIAVYLGPYYLGLWGFINLIIQYLAQFNFGISNSALALGAINKKYPRYLQIIFNNAIGMLVLLSILIAFCFFLVNLFHIPFGDKYNFKNYMFIVLLIGVLNYFISLFSNFFRLMGRLKEIAFSQSLLPLLFLICSFIFKGEKLLNALVYANLLAFVTSFFLFILNSPIRVWPSFNFKVIKKINYRGMFLFLYNTSFYLIIISTRTFVSAFYTVQEFGIFTFSFSLANIFLLLLESFSFLIMPKAINKFSKSSIAEAKIVLDKLRSVYIVTAHLLVHLGCLLFPVFLLFFPKYSHAIHSFRLIALSVVIYTNTFGFQSLLISKGFERKLGTISFCSLLINLGLLCVLVLFLKVNFNYVILATLISYMVYCILLAIQGHKALFGQGEKILLRDIISIFPCNLFVPYLISLGLIFINANNFLFIVPLLIFLGLNFKDFKQMKFIGKQLLNKPETLDV